MLCSPFGVLPHSWCVLFLLGGVIHCNTLCCHYRLRSSFFLFFFYISLQPPHPHFSFTKQYVSADADKWTGRHNLCADKSVTEFAISSAYLSLQSKVAEVVSVFFFFLHVSVRTLKVAGAQPETLKPLTLPKKAFIERRSVIFLEIILLRLFSQVVTYWLVLILFSWGSDLWSSGEDFRALQQHHF